MSRVSFEAICGAGELSANAYVIEAHGRRLLLDAGSSQHKRADWVDRIEAPDLCWLSHVHWDHLGALGALKRRFPRLPCLSTQPTRRLASVALAQAGLDDHRASALASQLQAVPVRQYFELSRFLGHLSLDGPRLDKPHADKFRAMVFPAGHISGAGMLLVEIELGEARPFRLLYTSDFCGHDQPVVPGALFPRTGDDFPIDVLIMEGVLATTKAYDKLEYADELARLQQAVAQGEGGALLGVASLGQATEVAAALVEHGSRPVVHRLLEPVFEATDGAPDKTSVDFADEADCRRALRAGGVVVAPGEQYHRSTPAGRLLEEVVARSEATVVVVNRAFKKTTAGHLVRASRGDAISAAGRKLALEAKVEHILLPNHAPRHQLVAAANAVAPKRLVLVHGHRSRLFALKRAVEKSGFSGAIEVPQNRQRLEFC